MKKYFSIFVLAVVLSLGSQAFAGVLVGSDKTGVLVGSDKTGVLVGSDFFTDIYSYLCGVLVGSD